MGDEQEPRPPQHITASASGHAQMPIAAGDMINYWGDAAGQRDFRLHLNHEADEVVLEPGRATLFAIEIRNDAASEQRLELSVARDAPRAPTRSARRTVCCIQRERPSSRCHRRPMSSRR